MTRYAVTEIFRSLQGEGHFVGTPMVFVRLAGCSVTTCSIRADCDEAPWKAREVLDAEQIAIRVQGLQASGIVCLTGGEPTDHDLVPLLATLRLAGMRLHLETSGVRSVQGVPFEWITVSPKTSPSELKQRTGHTIKLVVRPEWSDYEAWEIARAYESSTSFFHHYLQPLYRDGKPVNLEQVTRMVLDTEDASNPEGRWTLGIQAHKAWSVR